MPLNSSLLKDYHRLVNSKRIKKNASVEGVLRIRKIRSLSGIVVVSVLTKPYRCPGKCLYCPKQAGAPKSYLKEEPAVARAISLNYDPQKQVRARIRALEETGHSTDKIDLRIIGGTWSYYPKKYQNWFIKKCFEACQKNRKPRPQALERIQKRNEGTKHRIIGITIETRPDYISKAEIKRLRNLGVTRVELGIQSIYDDVLEANERGHGVKETIEATKLLKDAGFKICYQMMPNLFLSSKKRDIDMFKELFSNQDFCPDYLKIYPCAVLKEAKLYTFWEKKLYRPYNLKELIKILAEIKKTVPVWCRIQRIIRDIPSNYIPQGGTKTSNLRQILSEIQKKEGWRCKCIRCREIKDDYNPKEKIHFFREDYSSSCGREIFLSIENKGRTKLYSLLRLRIPSQCFEKKKHFISCLNQASIIREMHTYGIVVPISKKQNAPQHKGLGKKLIRRAESITKKEFGLKKIAVISGVGVRNYYKKMGYKLEKTYMIKNL